MPGVIGQEVYFPRIGIEDRYFDWRKITNHPDAKRLINIDLLPAASILHSSWNQTISYIENQWRLILVP